jgi:hypothetical protein
MSRWTNEELRELATLWPTHSASQIAKRLHRLRSAIRSKAMRLHEEGLLRRNRPKHLDVNPPKRPRPGPKPRIIAKPPPPPPVDDSLDHTLAATTETAKEASAKAVEWHVTGRFTHVSISDDIKTYSIDAFLIGNGAPGDCEDGRGHCRAGAEGEGEIEG